MTTHPNAAAIEALEKQLNAHDELNSGLPEPYLSNRENLKVISLTIKEAKAIRTALTAPTVKDDEVVVKRTDANRILNGIKYLCDFNEQLLSAKSFTKLDYLTIKGQAESTVKILETALGEKK